MSSRSVLGASPQCQGVENSEEKKCKPTIGGGKVVVDPVTGESCYDLSSSHSDVSIDDCKTTGGCPHDDSKQCGWHVVALCRPKEKEKKEKKKKKEKK